MSRSNTLKHRRASKAYDNGYWSTDASPYRKDVPNTRDRLETALKSGPVKQWADMTAEERARVMASIRPPGVRE